MSSRVSANSSYLRSVINNCDAILAKSSRTQIQLLVEILFNIQRIPLSPKERRSLLPFLPVIKFISELRSYREAREQLLKFGRFILPVLLHALLDNEGV